MFKPPGLTIKNESDVPFTATKTQWRVRKDDGTVFSEDIYTTDLGSEESKTFTINFTPAVAGNYSLAAMINPDAKNPPDEINFKTGDWPGDNRQHG